MNEYRGRNVLRRLAMPVLTSLLLVALVLGESGCSTVVLTSTAGNTDDSDTLTLVSYFWQNVDPGQEIDCSDQGFKQVQVKTNWLYSLCGVVTFGAVVPYDVIYMCASKPPEFDDDGLGRLQDE